MAKTVVGETFGRLTAISMSEVINGERYFICECSCDGNRRSYNGVRLRSGKTTSCGCYNREQIVAGNIKRNMRLHADLVGNRFGRLIVVRPTEVKKLHWHYWCVCDCGKEKEIDGSRLRLGRTQSCGCYNREQIIKSNTRHGMESARVYHIWVMMKDRCNTANPRYGGRGITYDPRWNNFIEFYKDMGDPPTDKHTLDRKDGNLNYCKTNCRWATMKQQQNNRSTNHNLTYLGKTMSIAAWSEEIGINRATINSRLKRGWSPVEALSGSSPFYK